MPIYEYGCRGCGHDFEALVRGKKTPRCPSCDGDDLERRLTAPGLKTEGTRSKAMRAAKKRDQARARDRMHERIHYEKSHDRHG